MQYRTSELSERERIEDAVVRLFVATDERDWTTVADCFTDPFTLDMTSLVGGAPASMKPSEVCALWSAGFQRLDHVHHQVGNFQTVVSGATARVRCYGIAYHHRAQIAAPIKTRTFVGSYELTLAKTADRWRIELLKFNLKFIDGNLELDQAT